MGKRERERAAWPGNKKESRLAKPHTLSSKQERQRDEHSDPLITARLKPVKEAGTSDD